MKRNLLPPTWSWLVHHQSKMMFFRPLRVTTKPFSVEIKLNCSDQFSSTNKYTEPWLLDFHLVFAPFKCSLTITQSRPLASLWDLSALCGFTGFHFYGTASKNSSPTTYWGETVGFVGNLFPVNISVKMSVDGGASSAPRTATRRQMSPSSDQNIKLTAGKGYHKRYKRQGLYHRPRAPHLLILWCYVGIKNTFIVWLSKKEKENIVMEVSRPQALNTWILKTFLLLQFLSASLLSVSWIVDHWTQDVYVGSSQDRTIQWNFINTETAAMALGLCRNPEPQPWQITVAVYVPLEQALKRDTPPFRHHSDLTGLLVPVPDPHAHGLMMHHHADL